jgi:hypothetical protein
MTTACPATMKKFPAGRETPNGGAAPAGGPFEGQAAAACRLLRTGAVAASSSTGASAGSL